jgi:hypothetical protein
MFGGTAHFMCFSLKIYYYALQGFANVFYLLRPRIQSLKSNPEFYFTAAYLCFHYDEIRQRVTKSVFSQVCRDLEVNRRGDELRALDGHGRNRRL